MGSSETPGARPTLWRTCRVLANRTRLRILGHLLRQPGQTVSQVAESLGITRPVASQYLRALNARGLLKVRRVGRYVYYQPGADESVREAKPLLRALRRTFASADDPIDAIFRLATAFTHPRRQGIYGALHDRERSTGELIRETGMSVNALRRHLAKLADRGFVVARPEGYGGAVPSGALAKTLAEQAVTSRR